MKLLTILCASLLLLLPLTPQESPELKQASELTQTFLKLVDEQKFSEALPLAKRALEIRERLLPRDDPAIGNSLIYLVHIYDGKRDYGNARKTLERLLQYQTERFGADNVKLAPTRERLAVLYYRDGDKAKAEDAYKQSLASKEKEYGMDHVEVAHTLYGLGQLYRAVRDFERGAPVYRRTLRLYAKHSGVSSADFKRTITAYGCFGYETNKLELYTELQQIWYGSGTQIGTILNGKALSLPKPDYPEAARAHRFAGQVIVEVTIDETGKVIHAKDLCGGPPYLSEASVKSAYGARFSPTLFSGKPIQVTGVIQYNFVSR